MAYDLSTRIDDGHSGTGSTTCFDMVLYLRPWEVALSLAPVPRLV